MKIKNKHEFEMYKKSLVVRTALGKKILVISDLHIGFEGFLNEIGVLVPRFAFKEMLEELEEALTKFNVDEVVVLGDIKQGFGSISDQEWVDTLRFIDFLREKSKKFTLIQGNHDIILEPIVKKRQLELKKFYQVEDIIFCHGDEIYNEFYDKGVKFVVSGHLHPVVSIKEKKGVKKEDFKCFLFGKWKNKNLIIVPSFLPVVEGANLTRDEFGDYLIAFNINVDDFNVYVVSGKEEIYDFGKLRGLKD